MNCSPCNYTYCLLVFHSIYIYVYKYIYIYICIYIYIYILHIYYISYVIIIIIIISNLFSVDSTITLQNNVQLIHVHRCKYKNNFKKSISGNSVSENIFYIKKYIYIIYIYNIYITKKTFIIFI